MSWRFSTSVSTNIPSIAEEGIKSKGRGGLSGANSGGSQEEGQLTGVEQGDGYKQGRKIALAI